MKTGGYVSNTVRVNNRSQYMEYLFGGFDFARIRLNKSESHFTADIKIGICIRKPAEKLSKL